MNEIKLKDTTTNRVYVLAAGVSMQNDILPANMSYSPEKDRESDNDYFFLNSAELVFEGECIIYDAVKANFVKMADQAKLHQFYKFEPVIAIAKVNVTRVYDYEPNVSSLVM